MNIEEFIAMPYPTKTEPSRGFSIFPHCDNFFRGTPVRKIMLIHDQSGDHDYDEDMSQDAEIDISVENDRIYKQTQTQLFESLKAYPFQEKAYPSNLDRSSNYDDESKEDTQLEGEDFDWTPEYEGGIHTFDSETNTIWDLGDEYLYLGCGSDFGDGNFTYCTFVCITPKTNEKNDFKPQTQPTVEAYYSFDDESKAYIFRISKDEVFEPEQVTFCRLNTAVDMKAVPAEFLQAKNINCLFFDVSSQLEVFPDFSSLKNLQELRVMSDTSFDSYEHAAPERIKEMVQVVIPSVETLIIRKFKNFSLSNLKRISEWPNLKTLVLYEVDITYDEKEFEAFVEEIKASDIETIKIPGTQNLPYQSEEDEGDTKELSDYLPNKNVVLNYM